MQHVQKKYNTGNEMGSVPQIQHNTKWDTYKVKNNAIQTAIQKRKGYTKCTIRYILYDTYTTLNTK